MWYAECNLISGYTARGLICVVHSVQSGMCGPPCILYYNVFFFFNSFLNEQSGPEWLTVNNGQYFHCSSTEYTTRILCVQSSHKGPGQNMHMYGFCTLSSKKKQQKTDHRSLICILPEIPYHLDHGKRLTNEYPGLVKEPVIKSVFI